MTQQHVPEGSVIIPPYEVFSEVRSLTLVVRELIAADKHDAEARVTLNEKVNEIDKQLDNLRLKMWFIAGFASAIGGSIGAGLANTLLTP